MLSGSGSRGALRRAINGFLGHCLSQLFGLPSNARCNARFLLCKFFFDFSDSLCHGTGGRPIPLSTCGVCRVLFAIYFIFP